MDKERAAHGGRRITESMHTRCRYFLHLKTHQVVSLHSVYLAVLACGLKTPTARACWTLQHVPYGSRIPRTP